METSRHLYGLPHLLPLYISFCQLRSIEAKRSQSMFFSHFMPVDCCRQNGHHSPLCQCIFVSEQLSLTNCVAQLPKSSMTNLNTRMPKHVPSSYLLPNLLHHLDDLPQKFQMKTLLQIRPDNQQQYTRH